MWINLIDVTTHFGLSKIEIRVLGELPRTPMVTSQKAVF